MFFPSSDIAGEDEPELSLNVICARDQHEVLPHLFQWSDVIMSCSPLSNFPITRTTTFAAQQRALRLDIDVSVRLRVRFAP